MKHPVKLTPIIALASFTLLSCGESEDNMPERISYAQDIDGLVISYRSNEDGYYLEDYRGKESSLSLPEKIIGDQGEAPLVGIADYAFSFRENLKALLLPKSIQKLSKHAFDESYIETVQVTDSLLHIDAETISNSRIKTNEKGGVRYLSSQTERYFYAVGIASGTAPVELAENCFGIADGVFKNVYGRLQISPSLHVIGKNNFNGTCTPTFANADEELTLYKTEENFIHGFNGRNITISPKVENICKSCLTGCKNLTKLSIPTPEGDASHPYYGLSYLFGGGTWQDNREYVPSSLKAVHINKEGVKLTNWRSFYNCASIETISLSDGVTIYGNNAWYFSGVTNIEVGPNHKEYVSEDGVIFSKDKTTLIACPPGKQGTYNVPSSVKKLGTDAFACSSLDKINIQSSLEEVGDGCFKNCKTSIATVYNNGYYISDGDSPYSYFLEPTSKSVSSLTIHDKTKQVLSSACYEMHDLISVALPSNLLSIDSWAFGYCEKLQTINFPSALKRIGSDAFYKDSSLKKVVLPQSLERLDYGCFENTGVQTIVIPAKVNVIEGSSFYGCSALEDCKIHDGVKVIGSCAFYGCSALKSLTIPASCNEIQTGAFQGYDGVKSIVVDEMNLTYRSRDGILYSKDGKKLIMAPSGISDGHINIPEGTEIIGESAFVSCRMASISIPKSVYKIEDYAFASCTQLSSITIPGNVKTIGSNCFYLANPTNITLEEGIENIGEYFISYAENLKSLYLPSTLKNVNGLTFRNGTLVELIVNDNSPYLSSENGIVFDKAQSMLLACPSGKTGTYTIPATVTSIGSNAFEGTHLSGIDLPPNLERIGDYAFLNAHELTKEMTFPSTLKSIGYWAFGSVPYLKTIYYDGAFASWVKVITNESFNNSGTLSLVTEDKTISL